MIPVVYQLKVVQNQTVTTIHKCVCVYIIKVCMHICKVFWELHANSYESQKIHLKELKSLGLCLASFLALCVPCCSRGSEGKASFCLCLCSGLSTYIAWNFELQQQSYPCLLLPAAAGCFVRLELLRTGIVLNCWICLTSTPWSWPLAWNQEHLMLNDLWHH